MTWIALLTLSCQLLGVGVKENNVAMIQPMTTARKEGIGMMV
jgi:hypothetical protein